MLKGETNASTGGLQTWIGTCTDWLVSSTEVAVRVTEALEENAGAVDDPTFVQALPTEPTVTSTNAPRTFGDGAGVIVAVAPPVVL